MFCLEHFGFLIGVTPEPSDLFAGHHHCRIDGGHERQLEETNQA